MPTRDISQSLDADATVYPGDPAVELSPAATHEADGYRVTEVRLGTHAGTHVDAPSHTEPEGRTLDTYDLSAFERDCVRVDCRDLGVRDPIPGDRVPAASDDVECVVFWTGWDDHWGSERYFDHPYLAPDAAERCASRELAIAIDTPNPDPTPTARAGDDEPAGYPAHHALLGNGSLVFENLTNLDAVSDRFELRAYPIRIDGDGAPVRAVGVPHR